MKSMRKWVTLTMTCCMAVSATLSGCTGENATNGENIAVEATEDLTDTNTSYMEEVNQKELQVIDDKYRTYYEVFLHSFYDSNGDGTGDIKGLIEKLDYINDGDDTTDEDLGCNGIWLMPIMPSDSYHKYDVKDYENIDESYGTMEDFKDLVEECHERGIHIIIDLVMNHTSSQHPWFQEACKYLENLDGSEPSIVDCPYFDYYNFTKEPKGDVYYQIGDTDWYYEAQFWSEMPDLNLDSEAVRKEFDDITSFWMDLGVDGFRLDASGEYTSGNDSNNIEVLTWFNNMVKAKDENAYIVAEVWQDMDIYAKYYASGIDSCFDFAFGDAQGLIADSIKKSSGRNASSYGKALGKLDDKFGSINPDYIDAPFYTNHDTGRSAGYYSGDYSENMTKMAGAMNLLMSGNAFLYYGEELGMKGSGKDENKRAPMQWSSDSKEDGMCQEPEGMDTIKMKYGSLVDQEEDPYSVFNFYRETIRIRNEFPEIARGSVTFEKNASNEDICVLKKTWNGESLLLVFNLSEKEHTVDLTSVNQEAVNENCGINGALLTTDDTMDYQNGIITMPPFSVAVIK